MSAYAQGQTAPDPLPDSLQPGGMRPDATSRQPPASVDSLMEIPPMVERPLSADEGERIIVERFVLVDARDLPEHDIALVDLERLVEAVRLERPEGFTIGQLAAVTDHITNYYRARGLILAKAVLPVQTVTEGTVELQVIEGRLGRVLTEGNRVYSQRTLARPFRRLVGEPVSQQEAESSLLVLTDFPGLVAFGMFQPGQRVGETDLLVRVPNEQRFNGTVRTDNHGSDTTGLWRGRAAAQWNNVTGNADQLGLTLQHTILPANSFFAALDYHIIVNRYWQASAYARRNSFSVGGEFEELEIAGVSHQLGLATERIWLRSREQNLSTRVELASKHAETERFGSQANEDRLTVLTLAINYDSVDTRFSGLNYAGLEVSKGFNDFLWAMGDSDSAEELPNEQRPSRRGGNRDYAEGSFLKFLAFYSRLQNITANSSILARTEFQYSPDLLVPMEQYAIGGADHVRGFASSYALYDTGGLLSLEYIVQAPFIGDREAFGGWRWRDLLQFSLFYDHTTGEKNDPLLSEVDGWFQMSSTGAGMRFGIPNQLTSRLQVALPLMDESGNDEEEKAPPRVWFDLAWHF
ncbi:MAG: ShlB/FhaC/HecB family hemolysin secretion/activation protein [Natronospirillum sp.]